jgi:hypothetical protein
MSSCRNRWIQAKGHDRFFGAQCAKNWPFDVGPFEKMDLFLFRGFTPGVWQARYPEGDATCK